VLTVAAADRQGKLVLRYSNFGAAVDLLAPGGDVAQDSDGDGHPDGVLSYVDGDYAYYNGTSMAAPHVAGVAALVFAQRPQHGPAQVEADLVRHAVARTNAECPRPCGAGLLNADFVPSTVGAGPAPDPLQPTPPGAGAPPSVPAMDLAGALAAAILTTAALAGPRRAARPRRRP
jgi:serine protease